MLTPDNHDVEEAASEAQDGIPTGELLDFLADHAEKPLVFTYGGRAVKAGYNVSEVKAGRFSPLDCGANPESWSEIFLQLCDVDEGGRGHMQSGKFAGIITKVAEHVALDAEAKLTFELSKAEMREVADGGSWPNYPRERRTASRAERLARLRGNGTQRVRRTPSPHAFRRCREPELHRAA